MAKPETFTFPESESRLDSWMLDYARPGGMVTKIAFRDNTLIAEKHPAWEPINDGDFEAARDAVTSPDSMAEHVPWLSVCRTIADHKGIFRRFYVVRDLTDG